MGRATENEKRSAAVRSEDGAAPLSHIDTTAATRKFRYRPSDLFFSYRREINNSICTKDKRFDYDLQSNGASAGLNRALFVLEDAFSDSQYLHFFHSGR